MGYLDDMLFNGGFATYNILIGSNASNEEEYMLGEKLHIILHYLGGYSDEEIRSIVNLNISLKDKLKKLELKTKNFSLLKSQSEIHEESPYQFELLDKNKNRLATIGFFFTKGKENARLNIINIQGLKINSPIKVETIENWRVFLVKRVIRFCKKEGLNLSCELPAKFIGGYTPTISEKEYFRLIRQYLQTYLKSGIPIKNIKWHLVDPDIKRKVKSIVQNRPKNVEKAQKQQEKARRRKHK